MDVFRSLLCAGVPKWGRVAGLSRYVDELASEKKFQLE